MLEALVASGQSDAAFGRARGIADHRVRYWRYKLGTAQPERPASPASGFIPIRVTDAPTAPAKTETARVELHLVGGRRIVFHGTWEADALKPWLLALEVA